MNGNTLSAILVVAGFIYFGYIISVEESGKVNTQRAEIEFAKAGLQQCVDKTFGFHTVWQKECK